jgi:hypothetical protein
MVQTSGTQIYASVYANAGWRTAGVLLFNGDKRDQELTNSALDLNAILAIRGQLLKPHRVFDLETGQTLATELVDGKCLIREPLRVASHDYRLLGIEAE